MNLEAFKYYSLVVEEKSISKAAIKSHISQSALSQIIHKLEEDLDCELLNRSNKGVSLTPVGEIVLKYGNNIINNYHKMIEELNSYDANNNNIVIIGTRSLAAYSLPCMIYRIKKKFPEYHYKLIDKDVKKIISDIKDDLADVGFIDSIIEDEDLVYKKMGKEKVVLIAKSDYQVGNQISVEDLLNIEFIMCTVNQKTCEQLDDALKTFNKSIESLNVIFNADSLTSVKSAVLNGYGMAFVPYESVKHELYENSIKLVEIKDMELDYDIFMVSKKPNELSYSAKISKDYLIEIGRKSFC